MSIIYLIDIETTIYFVFDITIIYV